MFLGMLLVGAFLCELDLSRAHIVMAADVTAREKKAVAMLIDETAKRTGLHWGTAGKGPEIRVARRHGAKEGYRLTARRRTVTIAGNDERGVLFGVGRLLREMHMRTGSATLAAMDVTTAPKYALRGHQLGYRPKTNSYDGWDVPVWEQYMRDLAVFGTNAIELIPPRSDDARDSPLFPLPPMRMMTEMSRLADEYGLDVWIWYPAIGGPPEEWDEVFSKLQRVDAVFVPGGDPGQTEPKVLFQLLEKQARSLRKYHPHAQMWVSPQGFSAEWLEQFYEILARQQPAWLDGIVYGPQVRVPLAEVRARVPKRYPIRQYPDITHSRQCQYPVPDWDVAYAVTEAREVINPRPMDEASIFRATLPSTIGFITYSEGCNDDVNKIVWSALGWDPDAKVEDILRQYSRYFIGDAQASGFAEGLAGLERNWRGPLAQNTSVPATLARFQQLPKMPGNWRWEQALYRANYDAYTQQRLLRETRIEEQAMSRLKRPGSLAAIDEAERILDQAATPDDPDGWRTRVFELAEALFQSIRMQLSVEKYHAISVDRGATLDTVDVPLNNRVWLKQRFAEIRRLPEESARRAAIDEILHWTDAGPGGFYDDLGDPAAQPHLARGVTGFGGTSKQRRSWWNHAESLYDAALEMRYDGLDKSARYKLRVVYGGDSSRRKIRLTANGIEVHPLIEKPFPVRPVEFDIPAQATATGVLTLQWTGEQGLGGNGRGCQVSEVWLMRNLP